MRYLGLGVLIYAFISIAGFIFVAVVLMSFYMKKKVSKMDEVKWDLYFKSMSNSDYLKKFWIIYLISLMMSTFVGYHVFIAFGFERALLLCLVTLILGIIKMIVRFRGEMSNLLEKIDNIRRL